MAVDLEKRREAHRKEIGYLPGIVTRLHQPARGRVAQDVRRHVGQASLAHGRRKRLFDVLNGRAVAADDVTEIRPETARSLQMRRQPSWNSAFAAAFFRFRFARPPEVNPAAVEVDRAPAQG